MFVQVPAVKVIPPEFVFPLNNPAAFVKTVVYALNEPETAEH
jgi:hypothetical protein